MTNDITNPSNVATLTQKELFQCFLDAPFYEGGTISILGAAPRISEETMQERNFFYYGLEAVCLPDELPEQMIEELRECDDPAYEMCCAIGDLECLVRDLKVLEREFSSLVEAMRTDEPDEEATYEEVREWEDYPRYVLPVCETNDNTIAHANDMQRMHRKATAAIMKLSLEEKI